MSYVLNTQNIAEAVAEVEAYLAQQKIDSKEALRIRLGVEDTLLNYMDYFGSEKEFELKCGKSLGKLRVAIKVQGEMYDPFRQSGTSESVSAFMRQALASMGDMPIWRYTLGTNVVTFGLTRKHVPDLVHLLIALIAALLVCVVCQFLPSNVETFLVNDLLSPILDTFMSFLGAMAGPMIFLAVVWGIYSVGDAATFSVLGKRLLGRYALIISIVTIFFGLVIMPLFTLSQGESTASDTSTFSSLFGMVLDIIPGNLFTPFTEGNTLQILFVAIIVGLAMLFASEKTQSVALVMEQVSIIVQIIMDVISKLVPFFVFGSLVDIILGEDFSQVAQSYKLILTNVGGCAFLLLLYVCYVCSRTKVKPMTYIAKSLPTFIIGLTTASSSAAFATNRKTCSESFGIETQLADFGVPFGQVIFKPSVALLYLSSALCCAEIYGVGISVNWLISLFVMAIILSIATPPIPGGQLASYSVLFSQLAIPDEGIAIVMALGILLDFLETPTDLIGGQAMLILSANKFRMLNLETLRSKLKKSDKK